MKKKSNNHTQSKIEVFNKDPVYTLCHAVLKFDVWNWKIPVPQKMIY